MKMKEMSEAERPRERMAAAGPGALTVVELLAVLIASGTREKSAVEVAQEILVRAGWNVTGLFSMSLDDFTAISGVGPKKATTILAALELGRRFFELSPEVSRKSVTGPEMVYELFRSRLKGLPHEECWALFLNNAGKPVGRERITQGSWDATIISPAEILKTALDKRARSIILVHNHPSGDPTPSRADISQTEKLRDAARALSLNLLDHVIFSDDCFYSFDEERKIMVRQ